ncbi:hypothetical protein BJ970_005121 [Saccharopolyspora phatthalungensis]|uniref:Uncharacterized protein n=1 Tax=Saccharopolyspora phatthalungensis TaxID=664693 RepID=A0A840QC97_9PSEU|nr:hypothetical protein [Saccharopolyspora phatthalungensis]
MFDTGLRDRTGRQCLFGEHLLDDTEPSHSHRSHTGGTDLFRDPGTLAQRYVALAGSGSFAQFSDKIRLSLLLVPRAGSQGHEGQP